MLLPAEIWIHIAVHLVDDRTSLARFARMCKKARSVVDHPSVWRLMFFLEFGVLCPAHLRRRIVQRDYHIDWKSEVRSCRSMRAGWMPPILHVNSSSAALEAPIVDAIGVSMSVKGIDGAEQRARKRTRTDPENGTARGLRASQLQTKSIRLNRLFPGLRNCQLDDYIVIAAENARDSPKTRTMAIGLMDTDSKKSLGALLFLLPSMRLLRRCLWKSPRANLDFPVAIAPEENLLIGTINTNDTDHIAQAVLCSWQPAKGASREVTVVLLEELFELVVVANQALRQIWVFGRDGENVRVVLYVYPMDIDASSPSPISRTDFSTGRTVEMVSLEEAIMSIMVTVHTDNTVAVWRIETGELLTTLTVPSHFQHRYIFDIWYEPTFTHVGEMLTLTAHLASNIIAVWCLDIAYAAVLPEKLPGTVFIASEITGQEDQPKTIVAHHRGIVVLANNAGDMSVYDVTGGGSGTNAQGYTKATELAVMSLEMPWKGRNLWNDVFLISDRRRILMMSLRNPIHGWGIYPRAK